MSPCGLNTDDLTSLFYSTCQNILDTVAPVRTVQPKPKVQPWLNDVTRGVRTECRRAEHRWKKDRLQISLNILKDSLHKYQKTVRSEKSKYLSNMIYSHSHKPCVLFSTINAVLNNPQSTCLQSSASMCENFLNCFIVFINIYFPSADSFVFTVCPAVFDQFELASLREIIGKMKPSSCSLDIIPSQILKQTFETIGPKIKSILNSSLASGVVPQLFKHAIVLKKNIIWIHRSLQNSRFFLRYWRKLYSHNCTPF